MENKEPSGAAIAGDDKVKSVQSIRGEPIKLAERLKTSPDSREKIVAFLEKQLAETRAGNVAQMLVISRSLDGLWCWAQAGDATATEMIGRLEIVKHEITAHYVESMNAQGK